MTKEKNTIDSLYRL